MSICNRAEDLRDYAFDELADNDRSSLEQHLTVCADCTAELDRLRLTAAALRAIPDREIPQRIAFVSDRVFEPSPVARFFGGIWNSAARLGFASACILAPALVILAYHRPIEIRNAAPAADLAQRPVSNSGDIKAQIDAAVASAHAQDEQLIKAELESADRRHAREHRALLATMQEDLDVMQKRLGAYTLASAETPRTEPGQ
jgi:anti-sigma factor RsiW